MRYLRWSNRNSRQRITLLLGCASLIAVGGFLWLLGNHLVLAAAKLQGLRHHLILIAVISCIVAAAVTHRRRVAYTAKTSRSWLAAVPTSVRARRVESVTVVLAPVYIAGIVVGGFAVLVAAILGAVRLPWTGGLVGLGWLLAGAFFGAVIGLLIPAPRPVIPYPGSRYVPHRAARARAGRLAPSLAALGIWPIRRMFAMLQPRILARAVFPLLIAIPMGTAAADALVLIGTAGALTCLSLLAISTIWVMRAARRWLAPLPMSALRLGRMVAMRAVLAMIGLGAAAVWLARIVHS